MFQNLDVFKTAMAMARHAGTAQALSAQNMANADTPGYRAKDLPNFADAVQGELMAQRATRAGHMHGSVGQTIDPVERRIAADPNGNTVSLETEMLNSVAASRQHNRALAIYKSSLSILRTSLSRN
ncbi:FlgB family protein [Cognatishimia sp. F0-27]|uniref:FlgB family protein n=1 Tax=Cognatishimia sp. F0-27 TaxID=2816855 RepID=UPI001D0C1E7B|nr:FlgB family protein [Cognatishimia sp. F0-27]MCC1491214.1 FlgB family protein [Cognatishimia sp. F0-27]